MGWGDQPNGIQLCFGQHAEVGAIKHPLRLDVLTGQELVPLCRPVHNLQISMVERPRYYWNSCLSPPCFVLEPGSLTILDVLHRIRVLHKVWYVVQLNKRCIWHLQETGCGMLLQQGLVAHMLAYSLATGLISQPLDLRRSQVLHFGWVSSRASTDTLDLSTLCHSTCLVTVVHMYLDRNDTSSVLH